MVGLSFSDLRVTARPHPSWRPGRSRLADLERGVLVSALNGIVPTYLATGAQISVGTHPGIVAELAGTPTSNRVPAGASVSVAGTISPISGLTVVETLPLVDLGRLDREVACHVRSSTGHIPWRRLHIGGYSSLRLRCAEGALVALPRLAALARSTDPLVKLSILRARVAELWWDAGLRGFPLFVPAFERPSLDTLMLALGASAAPVEPPCG